MEGVVRSAALSLVVLLGGAMVACASGPDEKSTGQVVDDSVITSKVKTKLFKDPVTSGFDINVETYKGKVMLSGFVDSEQQRERAAEIAQGVADVESVDNNLVVKSEGFAGQ